MTRDDIVLLEDLNFNAWPALRQVEFDGWLLRQAGGDSRRVNSVNVLEHGTRPLEAKIDEAEAIYAGWGQRAIFRLTPLANPGLEEALLARGYTYDAPTFVQIARLATRSLGADVTLYRSADDAWLDGAIAIRGVSGDAAEFFRAQHRSVEVPSAWAMIREGNTPLACGVTAVERGWSGLLGIYVAKSARRRGLARQVTASLLAFAQSNGAEQAWLQVEQGNKAALPLYAELGFHTAYEYRHLVQPIGM